MSLGKVNDDLQHYSMIRCTQLNFLLQKNEYSHPQCDMDVLKWPKSVRRIQFIKRTLEELYRDRATTGDIKFIVDSEAIYAHRYILASNSPKYKAQFYGKQPDNDEISVEGVTTAGFKEFLQLFYLEDVILTMENIESVLTLVQQSLVPDFFDECIDFIKRSTTVDNLCTIYRLANTYDLKELKEFCEKRVSCSAKKLFICDDFLDCDRETLKQILALDSLGCEEGEVFDACILWARAACAKNVIDSSNPLNLSAALGDAITLVRFGSMTLEEFAVRQKSLEGFFTPEESNEIVYMIAKLDGFQPKKFTQILRDHFLECHLLRTQLREPIIQLDEWDALFFRCDRLIRLHGFVIASDAVNEMAVHMVNGLSLEAKREKCSVLIKRVYDETIVYFHEPIAVVPDKWYGLRYESSDLKGQTVNHAYYDGDVKSNGTLFRLRNYRFGVVSRLLFRTS